ARKHERTLEVEEAGERLGRVLAHPGVAGIARAAGHLENRHCGVGHALLHKTFRNVYNTMWTTMLSQATSSRARSGSSAKAWPPAAKRASDAGSSSPA